MKRFLILTVLYFVISSSIAQQVKKDSIPPATLLKIVNRLDSSFNAQIKQNNNTYLSKVKSLKTGLVNATSIEDLLQKSSLVLSYTSFTTLTNRINNPTSNGIVGSSFVDFVIDKASEKLIPSYPEDTIKNKPPGYVPAKSKFKSFMTTLTQNPIFKTLMAATPLTGVIGNVLQQASTFEPPRALEFKIPATDIQIASARKSKTSISIKQSISNNLGAGYDNEMVNNFYAAIKPRIDFYKRFNTLADSIDRNIYEKKIERIALKRQVQTSLTLICKTLNIRKDHFITDLDSILSTKSSANWMTNQAFTKSIDLSEQAIFYLPQVRDFYKDVVGISISYVNGYIRILEDYTGPANKQKAIEAGLLQDDIETTLKTLTQIRTEINTYAIN